MPERLKAILDKITAWWKKFNTKQRSVLISIAAVVIVALVILGVVISRPTQVELVEAQSASEASTIKGVLEDNNISYEVDSKLVFFVNKSDEVNAIMALGDNGIPAQAYSIDNVTDGSFSTTEADKQKKYQVYLEDKLKDHLEKQSYVNEASVDITMPDKDGTILKSKEEATAAVTLGLKDSITDDQAYAIARLVATALGNDTTKGITIIDKKANVLYSGGDSDTSAGLATSQLSYKQKLEEQVKNEVKKTLESSNIFSNIEVGMNLDIDFSKTETAQKNYTLPDGQTDTGLLDSESNYQSDATNGQAAVPGTDSNSDDTTYTTQDGTPSESSITDNDKKYLNDEKITTSKNDNTNSRRVVFSYLGQKEAVTELFSEVAPKIVNRPGGYTRILRTGNRIGDNAETCIIELVDFNATYTEVKQEVKKTTTRRRRSSGAKKAEATGAAVVEEAPKAETPAEEAPKAE